MNISFCQNNLMRVKLVTHTIALVVHTNIIRGWSNANIAYLTHVFVIIEETTTTWVLRRKQNLQPSVIIRKKRNKGVRGVIKIIKIIMMFVL